MRNAFSSLSMTNILIVLNLIAYLTTALLSANLVEMNTRVLVLCGALYGPLIFGYDEWWRLLSALFLHGGMTHLLMNMFSLYILGHSAQIYFEKRAFLAIYLFSGLIGAVASLAVHPQSVGIGASGAIFGIFGALSGFFLVHRERIEAQSKAFMKSFGMIIALNVLLGLSIPSIDMSAHIGGLVAGLIGGVLLSYHPRWWLFYSLSMAIVVCSALFYLQGSYA